MHANEIIARAIFHYRRELSLSRLLYFEIVCASPRSKYMKLSLFVQKLNYVIERDEDRLTLGVLCNLSFGELREARAL